MYTVKEIKHTGQAKNGKSWKKLLLEQNGMETEGLVWQEHPDFDSIAVGGSVGGTIETNGNYKNLVHEAQKQPSGSRTGAITAAQENKAKQIAHAQENSSLNVKIASTFRDATLLTTARMAKTESQVPLNVVQEEWNKWRGWLWARYDDPKEPEWIENMTNPF